MIGLHNTDLVRSSERVKNANAYETHSTVWVIPTRGLFPHQVVSSLIGLQRPMNQRIYGPLMIPGKEVGEAYNSAVEMILANPDLKKFKYLLTSEEDNILPGDGLLKLY